MFFCIGALRSPVILTLGWVAYCLAWNVCPTFPTITNGYKWMYKWMQTLSNLKPITPSQSIELGKHYRPNLMLSYAKLFKHAWSAWHLSAEDWRLPIFSRRQRHLYWPHSETSLKTQSLRGKMHAAWPGVYWIGRVFGSSVGTATGDRLTRRQGFFVKNWEEMSWNEMKDMKEMKCAKQIKSNTMSCSVLGSLVSCSPHLLKAPRTLKVYLSVGEEARPLIDCFSTSCEIADNVTLLPFCSKTVVLWALWSCLWDSGNRSGWWQNLP